MNRMGEGEDHRGYLQQVITRKENTSLNELWQWGFMNEITSDLGLRAVGLVMNPNTPDTWGVLLVYVSLQQDHCEKKSEKKKLLSLFFFYNNDKNSINSAETRIYSSLQTPQSLCLRICSSFLTHSILLALRSLSLSLSCHAKIGVDSCIISA